MWLQAEVSYDGTIADWRHSVREEFRFRGKQYRADEINSVLDDLVSPERMTRIDAVLEERTDTIVSVLEEIHDAANFKAVMRSAESLGFHWLHIIRREGRFVKNAKRASSGSEKWMQTTAWESTKPCLTWLKEQSYRIVAMSPEENATRFEDIDFFAPTALVFGNERDGISEETRSIADSVCQLPGTGFTNNYNLSVSVAISLFWAYQQRIQRNGKNGDLSDQDKDLLRAHYRFCSVRNPHPIVERLVAE